MIRFLRATAIAVLSLVVLVHAGDKKGGQLYSKPGQTADLEIKNLVTARQNCENWAMAAGLEAMLKQQDVTLDQNFWVMRISGGEVCASELPAMDKISAVVDGEFVLEDVRHVRLELHFTPGAPVDVDSVIMGVKKQQLSLMFLRGHLYYLMGVTYDESIQNDGTRLFVINELRLADTFSGLPGLTFARGRDNMDDIGGIVSITATPADQR